MNALELFATLTLDTTDFGDGIKGVNKEMLQAKKNIENVASSVKNAAKTFATIGAGVGAAGTAVFAFANKVSSTGDNIDKMSQKLGISAEGYQEWSHILEHSGTSIDSLQSSMKTLATAAETGSDAFEKLGLSQEEISGMNQEGLFNATIAALQNVSSETERTYLAGQLLGRGATELGPLLNTSAEDIEAMRQNLHDMGAVMSDEAVKNSAAFQDSLTNLKSAFSGAANGLANDLIPKFTELMDKVTVFVADGGLDKIIAGFQNLTPLIAGAASAMVTYKASSAIAGVVTAVTKALDGQAFSFKALFAVMNASPFALIATLIGAVGTALVTLYMTNEDFRNKVNAAWNTVKDTISNVVSALKTFFTTTLPNAIDTAVYWLKNLPDKFREVGANLLTGLWNGISDKIAWLKDKVSGVVNTIKGWFTGKDGFDEHSPSKWSKQVFRYVMEGGGEGLDAGLPGLMQSVGSVTDRVKSGLDFGTASVDFSSSGLGSIGKTIISGSTNNAMNDRPIYTNVTIELDGSVVARKLIGPLRNEARMRGTSLVY